MINVHTRVHLSVLSWSLRLRVDFRFTFYTRYLNRYLSNFQIFHHGIFSQHATVFLPPVCNRTIPFLFAHLMLVNDALWQQSIVCQEASGMIALLIISMSRLNGVWGQQDGCFRWAVYFVREDSILHLQSMWKRWL